MNRQSETDQPIDLIALREKYEHERTRRVRPDGVRQYQATSGSFGYYARDPYVQPVAREPRADRVDALVIGAGFGGPLPATIGRAEQRGRCVIEPTRLAEEDWERTVRETAYDNRSFQARCTPGYYNGEGGRSISGASFSPGPIAFQRLLANWRSTDLDGILRPTAGALLPADLRQ